jgi:hypothetical protein
MPGQLGNVQRTIQNLTIVKIMPEENIMLVKGSVPGHKGSVVIIKPTQKKYTPKEIFTEKSESNKTDQAVEAKQDTTEDSVKTDDTTQKQTNDNSGKEA